jgi:hypothetical protein
MRSVLGQFTPYAVPLVFFIQQRIESVNVSQIKNSLAFYCLKPIISSMSAGYPQEDSFKMLK